LAGDVSRGECALVALGAALRCCGLSEAQSAYVDVLWRWTALQLCVSGLEAYNYTTGPRLGLPHESQTPKLAPPAAELLRFGARRVCGLASQLQLGELPLSLGEEIEQPRPLCQLSSKRLEDNWHSGLSSSTRHRLSGRRSPDCRRVKRTKDHCASCPLSA